MPLVLDELAPNVVITLTDSVPIEVVKLETSVVLELGASVPLVLIELTPDVMVEPIDSVPLVEMTPDAIVVLSNAALVVMPLLELEMIAVVIEGDVLEVSVIVDAVVKADTVDEVKPDALLVKLAKVSVNTSDVVVEDPGMLDVLEIGAVNVVVVLGSVVVIANVVVSVVTLLRVVLVAELEVVDD